MPARAADPDPDPLDSAVLGQAPTDFLHHEVRKGGNVVVLFRGIRTDPGATVTTRVFPVTALRANQTAIDRSFTFPSVDQARAFVDETLVALEYLGCAVA
jgi:hypothetical protein